MNLAQLYSRITRNNGTPLEQQYSPADAFLIGAGSTLNGLGNTVEQGYYKTRNTLANLIGNTQDAARYIQQVKDLQQTQENNDKLYQPLAKAFPYSTTTGEAVPWVASGLTGGGEMMAWNAADRGQQDAAKAMGYRPVSVNDLFSPSKWNGIFNPPNK